MICGDFEDGLSVIVGIHLIKLVKLMVLQKKKLNLESDFRLDQICEALQKRIMFIFIK